VSWPFASALAKAGRADSQGGLAEALRLGRSGLFRGFVAWRLRRAQRSKRRLGRLLDRTGLPAAPRITARALRVVVVSPVRMIVSAPFARLGGLGTRLSLPGARK
jgi:hypothetical protein